ncbi:hypothetical protein RA267_27830, partial [Pseudomonas syringae pv. tagetis]|uniref:hypothetical protein n=1 Tax=Pseudomonas syringae group genomosp. 7 TaxID=251699 RepID=UPI00376FDD6D
FLGFVVFGFVVVLVCWVFVGVVGFVWLGLVIVVCVLAGGFRGWCVGVLFVWGLVFVGGVVCGVVFGGFLLVGSGWVVVVVDVFVGWGGGVGLCWALCGGGGVGVWCGVEVLVGCVVVRVPARFVGRVRRVGEASGEIVAQYLEPGLLR